MSAGIAAAAVVELPIGRRTELLAGLARAERIVGRAFLGVAQHLVGFADLLEPRLGVLLFADVGVVLAREAAIRALDVVGRRIAGDAHDRVVVFVFHGRLEVTRLETRSGGAQRRLSTPSLAAPRSHMLHIARMQAGQLLATALAAIGFAAAAVAVVHALLNKRRPQSAFGWIAVCLTLPFARRTSLLSVRHQPRPNARPQALTRHPAIDCPTEYVGTPPPQLLPLARLGSAVSGWPLTAGNRVELLHEAAAIFDAMIAAIEQAREYVYFSTYIFDGGPLGQRFAAALVAAAERGADVRVLLDGVGEWYSWHRASTLFRGTRVRFARFLPPRLLPPTFNVNLRNHRKILVVDGIEAFTGGINVRDRYLDELGTRGSSTRTFA